MRKLKSAIKKTVDLVLNRYYADWIYDQFIPLQVVYRSALEYDPTYYGNDEFYAPIMHPEHPARHYPQLGIHYQPQAIPKPYHFTVRNATITADNLVDPANSQRDFLENYPEPTLWPEGYPHRVYWTRRFQALKYGRTKPADFERGYLFSNRSWDNFYHFLMDSCLRFVDLEECGAIDAETTIFVHAPPNPWQKAYMNLLGIDPSRVVVTRHARFNVDDFVVASPRRQRFVCSMDAIRSLQSRILSRIPPSSVHSRDRIYISRAADKIRRVVNEDELVDMLEELGFASLRMQDMSVEEQVTASAAANLICAPHGAGLANLVFSSVPRLFELLPDDRWSYGYFIPIVEALGGSYTPFVFRPCNDKNDFVVDVGKVHLRIKEEIRAAEDNQPPAREAIRPVQDFGG